MVAYHQLNNVSDIFVRAQLPETDSFNNTRATPGSFWCKSSRCTTCPYIDHGLHRNLSFKTLSQQQSLCFPYVTYHNSNTQEAPLIHKDKTIEPLGIKTRDELQSLCNPYYVTSVYIILQQFIFCIFIFFPKNPDEDWYWPVEILYTSAFFTLFDQSLQKYF